MWFVFSFFVLFCLLGKGRFGLVCWFKRKNICLNPAFVAHSERCYALFFWVEKHHQVWGYFCSKITFHPTKQNWRNSKIIHSSKIKERNFLAFVGGRQNNCFYFDTEITSHLLSFLRRIKTKKKTTKNKTRHKQFFFWHESGFGYWGRPPSCSDCWPECGRSTKNFAEFLSLWVWVCGDFWLLVECFVFLFAFVFCVVILALHCCLLLLISLLSSPPTKMFNFQTSKVFFFVTSKPEPSAKKVQQTFSELFFVFFCCSKQIILFSFCWDSCWHGWKDGRRGERRTGLMEPWFEPNLNKQNLPQNQSKWFLQNLFQTKKWHHTNIKKKNKQQTTNNKHKQTTNNKQQTTNNKQQTTNNKQQTTNNKQQTTNNKQQTTNNKQQQKLEFWWDLLWVRLRWLGRWCRPKNNNSFPLHTNLEREVLW